MDATQDGFVVLGSRFRIKEANRVYCRMTGFSIDELIGMHVSELAANETPEVTAARFKRIISNGSEVFETWHKHKDGSNFEVEISAIYLNQTPGIWSLICFCRNISDRKRAEAESAARIAISDIFRQSGALSETCQKLAETLVTKMGFPIAVIALHDRKAGEIVYVGTAGTPDGFHGKRLPVGRSLSGSVVISGQALCESHISRQTEKQFEPLSKYSVETFICVPMRIGDEVTGTLSVADMHPRYNAESWVSNLTSIATALALEIKRKEAEQALRDSEALYRSILEASPDGIAITDLEGNIRKVSPANIKMFGYSSEQELLGRSILEFIVPEDRERAQERITLLQQGILAGPAEYQVVRADGSTFYCDVNAKFLLDETGQPSELVMITRDITERKLAETKLKESEERLRALVETTSDWIWEVDRAGHYTQVNSKVEEILGYTAQEVIGRSPFDFMPEEEAKRVQEIFSKIAASEKPFAQLENINLHRDGHLVVLETSGVPVCDADGKFCGYRGMDRDITERKQAEEALRKSEHRFATIFHDSPLAICTTRFSDGELVDVNDAFLNVFGYEREEVIGKKTIDLNLWANPEDRKEVTKMLSMHGSLSNSELNFRKKSGEIGIALVSSELIDLGGEMHMLNLLSDITERKQTTMSLMESEARYRLISENMGDVIWMFDLEKNRYTYVSPSVERVLGYSTEETLKHQLDEGLMPDSRNYVINVLPELIEALASGDESARTSFHEVVKLKPDGSMIPIEVVATLVQNKSGKVTGMIGITRDISKRKRAEEKLKETEEKFRLTFFTSPDSITISKLDNGEYAEVNEGFCQLLERVDKLCD